MECLLRCGASRRELLDPLAGAGQPGSLVRSFREFVCAISQRVRERSRGIGIRMAIDGSVATVARRVADGGRRHVLLVVVWRSRDGAIAPPNVERPGRWRVGRRCTHDDRGHCVAGRIGAFATLARAWRAMRIDPVQTFRRA
jgi:hypothetical protein